MSKKQHSRSILSGELRLYITDNTSPNNDQTAIEIPSDGTLGDIFNTINKSIHKFDLLKCGESLNFGEETLVADLGISAEENLILTYPELSQEQQLLDAFKNTNAASLLNWNHESQNCSLWKGIECDQQGNVDTIELNACLVNTIRSLTGTINWSSLPNTLQKLLLVGTNLSGTINLSQLPQSLTLLSLVHNRFYGSIDLANISSSNLQYLFLHNNLLTGSIDLLNLPQTLIQLMLQHNQFNGTIDLSQIPSNLRSLHFENNKLNGLANLSLIPTTLRINGLSNNQFTFTRAVSNGSYADASNRIHPLINNRANNEQIPNGIFYGDTLNETVNRYSFIDTNNTQKQSLLNYGIIGVIILVCISIVIVVYKSKKIMKRTPKIKRIHIRHQ